MTAKIVLATRNKDKLREIQDKFRDFPVNFLSVTDFPFIGEVEEDRPDLLGNAVKKAEFVAQESGLWALADDTGLEVDALSGAPGVYSARYSGPSATYESNCNKLLEEMTGVSDEKRTAHFRTVLALKTHSGLYCVEGSVEGKIGYEKIGSHGFGYDPVFVLPSGKTLAELDLTEKNLLSHRGQALDRLKPLLEFLLNQK